MAEINSLVFKLFPCLPPEIRLQIWRDALLTPAVWFALDESADADHRNHQHDHDRSSCPDVTMVPLQSACSSHWVGQACVESRRLAESLRGPFPQKPCFAWDRRLFYTDWDRTTVYFGNGSNAAQVLEALPEKEKALFRHVAVQFESQSNVEEFMKRLRRCNPDIRTISVFVDTDFPVSCWLTSPQSWPSAEMVKTLVTIAVSFHPEISQVPCKHSYERHARDRLLEAWSAPWLPPFQNAKYYFLPPSPTNC